MCPTGPKIPVGLIHHILQLYLPSQLLFQNKFKVFDLGGQLQCVSTEGWSFRPLKSLFLVNDSITIFHGMIEIEEN